MSPRIDPTATHYSIYAVTRGIQPDILSFSGGRASLFSVPFCLFMTSDMGSDQGSHHQLSALDQHVAPGLRLWMLIALVSGVLLIMVVLVCCFMRIRIPRTKRQIDLIAAKRKMRNKGAAKQAASSEERTQAIVMNSMRPKQSTEERPIVSGSKTHTEV